MAEVVLDNLSKSFGRTRAVRDLSLTIADGEFIVLLGPTGAGKTTTLRLIAGIERPDAGSIAFAGTRVEQLAPAERDVTFVFQQYSLYPHLTVRENLAFPLKAPGRRLGKPPSTPASPRSPGSCASTTSSTTAPPASPAARCSASPSAAPWSASRRST